MIEMTEIYRRSVVVEIATMVNDGVAWNYEFVLRPVCDNEYDWGRSGLETLAHMVACLLDRRTGMGDIDTVFVRDTLELDNRFVLDQWSKSVDGVDFWKKRVNKLLKKLEVEA